jgi:hypothetical protein
LPNLNDIVTAPAQIQTAAKSVVRIRTARQSATGFFISATGLLLTNNHVLGDSVCATEGCYAQVTFMYQRGEPSPQPVTVFVIPLSVDVGLDMALVQLYNNPGGTQLSSPDYLTFNSQDSESLIGKHVTIVGHPEDHLKKWTDGFVIDAVGEWFQTTAYALPGESGSPVLDDDGKIVGLLHRGPTTEDLFTSSGANMYSIGTASGSLITAMTNTTLPSTMLSVSAPTTTANFLANDLVYLNAKMTTINVGGTSVSGLSLLGNACDATLAQQNFVSPDDLQNALTPCYHAETWIDCRSDAIAVPYSTVCPSGIDSTNWANRFQDINQEWISMNGQMDYYSISFAQASLQLTVSAGIVAGAQTLQQSLAVLNPVLDYGLAYYLSAFNISSYNNTLIKDYVVNYQNVLHYEQEATYIALAADWLGYDYALSRNDLLSVLSRLHNDPNVSVGSKLYIEDIQYQLNAL